MPFSIRKVHTVATAVVVVQLLIWTTTGFAFTLFDFDAVHGTNDRREPAALDVSRVRLTPADAARVGAADRSASNPAAVESVRLKSLAGEPVYDVEFAGGREVLVDARTGVEIRIDAVRASAIARGLHRGTPVVQSVERREDGRRVSFIVHLNDARTTEVVVDAKNGEVTEWRNRPWRVFDALWSAHVLGYVDRHSPANWPLRIVGFVAVFAAWSGAALLAGKLWKRRTLNGLP